MTALPTAPSPEDFRALARSSPLRWSTVRAAVRWTGESGGFLPPTSPTDPGVRAWVRRPGALRVETLDGQLLQAGVEEQQTRIRTAFALAPAMPSTGTGPGPPAPPPVPPHGPEPRQRPDGLLSYRPVDIDDRFPDAPMYQNYYWVAMFDPFELTAPFLAGDDGGRATAVEDVAVVDHHGRTAWEALVRPLEGYDPRCSCCPLLDSARADAVEAEAGGPVPQRPPGFTYAEAYRVRLDVGTGICVRIAEVGGSRAGSGHDMTIEAVDETMADELFDGR